MGFDYAKIGFKCGLELHQELDVGKLFCRCASSLKEDGQILEVERKLRPVAGETGEVDRAAFYEFMRDRTFIYHGYRGEACLVDIDAEPPHKVNKAALEIALKVSLLLNMEVPRQIRIMRKIVTDGSSPSGFQRTSLVALGVKKSVIKTSKGSVALQSMNLEEDSCKIEKKDGCCIHYSLSRLGIPLIELGTEPDIKDPLHAKEVALSLGRIFRSFKGVKRGIGTIRQDVNVSVRGGARVEIKGWQDLNKLPQLIENEVERQVNLIRIKDKLNKKGVCFDDKPVDCSYLFKDTDSRVISISIGNKGVVMALVLCGMAGFLKESLYGGKTLGKELSEYAKAYGVNGMIHTDENLSKYELETEFDVLCKKLGSKPEDAVIIITGQKEIANKAINAVYERAKLLLKCIPEETRIPNQVDATSLYARPLPGEARMYPETDEIDIEVDDNMLLMMKKSTPELLEDKENRYVKDYGINRQIARSLADSRFVCVFENMIRKFGSKYAKKIANFFVNDLADLRKREKIDIDSIPESFFVDIFDSYINNQIVYEAVFVIVKQYSQERNNVATIIDEQGLRCLSRKDAEVVVSNIVATNKSLSMGSIMGLVMKKLRGKVDGSVIAELVKKKYSA